MSEATFEGLRAAISAPRASDRSDGDDLSPIRVGPRTITRYLLDLLPQWSRGGEPSESIFDLPLTRITSGTGGLVGGLIGAGLGLPHGLAPLLLYFCGGAIVGAGGAVALLVGFAGLAHRLGARAATALLVLIILAIIGVATTPI